MSRLVRPALLITLAIGLTTCGQKGPLRRPEAGNLTVWTATPTSQIR